MKKMRDHITSLEDLRAEKIKLKALLRVNEKLITRTASQTVRQSRDVLMRKFAIANLVLLAISALRSGLTHMGDPKSNGQDKKDALPVVKLLVSALMPFALRAIEWLTGDDDDQEDAGKANGRQHREKASSTG